MTKDFEPIIGLEVHAQMQTKSKAFCACATTYRSEPNTNTCPVCLGHPGVLPVLNEKLVEFIVMMGLATQCTIRPRCGFARKNYFYPDLPKGYQISQYDDPICHGGWIEIELTDGQRKRIGITRIHMEEDAGKSIHDVGGATLVDLNRCGVPLIEIVSEPDLRSPQEAHAYLTQIKQIVTYLGICDGNMEEGSLRCDANVSVRPRGTATFGTKTEVKNMNSFRNVERALEFEIERQCSAIERSERIVQQTMLWDANKNAAVPMRSKEEAHDYRYFPEPDLVQVSVSDEWKEKIGAALPELPMARRDRFISDYSLPAYDANVLTMEKPLADYFDGVCAHLSSKSAEAFKLASNWTMGDFMRVLKEKKQSADAPPITAASLAQIVDRVADGTLSSKMAKEVFEETLHSDEAPRSIIERRGLAQVSDATMIGEMLDKILRENPDNVAKYFSGREQLFGFFVGQVLKATQGKANPQLVADILRTKLDTMKEAR